MKHFFYKIRHLWYDIVRGVSNLAIWFSVIWKDRWWDHHFFFVILHKKLSLMEKNFRKHGCYTRAEKDADKMKIVVNLLDRIIKDEYFENADKDSKMKPHYKTVFEKEDELIKQDIEMTFKLLKKYIRSWWD